MLKRLLVACGFVFLSVNAHGTIYVVEEHPEDTNKLKVNVTLPDGWRGKLVLRGAKMGVRSQVLNVLCGYLYVKESPQGVWELEPGVHRYQDKRLSWEIELAKAKETSADEQQSFRNGCFMLLSEASSLPRLEGLVGKEYLRMNIAGIINSHPLLDDTSTMQLDKNSGPPLFLILNAEMRRLDVLQASDPDEIVTSLIDDRRNAHLMPGLGIQSRGLYALCRFFDSNEMDAFTIAWCGIKSELMACSGATGRDVLLVNYPIDGESKFGKVLPLYVAFHEAFHQLSQRYPEKRPVWVEESLASYFGCRALRQAYDEDDNRDLMDAELLIMSFKQQGEEKFHSGLLEVNAQVEKGDRRLYGAFYTKGVSFWADIDETLSYDRPALEHFLPQLLSINDKSESYVEKLQKVLDLDKGAWASIVKKYLY